MSTHKGMLAVRVFAVLVIVGVGAAAFRLSFATLRALAVSAHIPASDAWLFPLIVDGTIIQATLGWLVLAKSPERKYFIGVLAAGSLVSVAGNSIHAAAAGHVLPTWLCAVVAAIAPISLLIDTHGLAVLFRAAQRDSSPAPIEAPELVSAPALAETADPVVEPAPVAEPVAEVPVPVPAPVVPAAPARPVRAAAPVVRPVRPARPVQQQMLPIAIPAGS